MEKSLAEIEKIAQSPENSKIRAEIWGDFVGWENRWKEDEGFLLPTLKKYGARRILDVALGDSVDTVYLLKQGFDVQANEIDDAFRAKAVGNAKKEGFNIVPTSVDWRDLGQVYPPTSFDAAICTGNSFCHVFGRGNQQETLRQFLAILKPEGVLVIDERNFQKILENRQLTLGRNRPLVRRYLYTGEKVKAKWIEIADHEVFAELSHLDNGKRAYYKGYPLKRNELLRLLKEVGFSQITKFSDYEEGNEDDADFYQYVCVKTS